MATEKELAKLVNETLKNWSDQMPKSQLMKLKNDFWEIANLARKVEGRSWVEAIAEGASKGRISSR